MVDRNQSSHGMCGKPSDPLCCISVNKIFDSARDKDCLEDVRVHICDCYQEIVDRATAIRCKSIDVIDTNISIETVPFNKGYYQVTIRYYFCLIFECCLCNGRSEEVKGLCAFDKKIILYGSEKNVNVFTSDPDQNNFCQNNITCTTEPTLPTVTVEVAAPICLDTKIVERCRPFGHCCMCVDAIPDNVRSRFNGCFNDDIGANSIYVTIGVFSIIRMERPVQLILPACNLYLPEKDSTPSGTTDPCGIFGKMGFPVNEFFPYMSGGESLDRPQPNNNGCCK
ncbi:hypothetical protein LJB90_00445 [Eubacteriales bacterium OttesenSCG-928-G02]|nr:hypothetical protein [Eubacteriales bacterium OttesenSCG-928-G02]